MFDQPIHLCHDRGDSHWLTPDPAWSGFSHGQGLCIRSAPLSGERRVTPLDVAAGLFERLVNRVRVARRTGA